MIPGRRNHAAAPTGRPKYYVLEMFPYPSGRIHMGHVRNYVMGDVIARFRRAQRIQRAASHGLGCLRHAGRECRHRAWRPPRHWTYENIATMREAAQAAGPVARLEREFATCDPEYYRTAGLFLDFMSGPGLAQGVESQLGPGRQHRAGQRTGDRRPRLALGRWSRSAS
jgi:leucyl-tRNA synthetase